MSLLTALELPANSILLLKLVADQQTMLNELQELREILDYQTRLLQWCADGVERHELWTQLAQAGAERLSDPTVH